MAGACGWTAFKTGRLGTGDGTVTALHEHALATPRESFSAAVSTVEASPTSVARYGPAIVRAARTIRARLARVTASAPPESAAADEVIDAAAGTLRPSDELVSAVGELKTLTGLWMPASLREFLGSLALRKEEEEDLARNTVNIMTVHKAKGLDACVVILAAAEEELFPGRGGVDEERRLFYVSLTRAKHALFITYANRRLGRQGHAGTGGSTHQRTRFLDGTGLASRVGHTWVSDFTPDLALLSPVRSNAGDHAD